jgi:DNA-binding transcriptional LysR family regulator
MADVELRELRYFIAVAEELNFTRAAERLGMAQPPLSTAIGRLERKLGVTLLTRTSRRVTLTAAGATLLEQARIAVETVGGAIERTRRQGNPPDRLVVAVKADGGTDLLRRITRHYGRDPRLPAVRLLFSGEDGPAATVRSGTADVAIVRAPFDARGLDTEILLVEPRVAVLPADHRLARRSTLCRADLAGEPMPRWTRPVDAATAAHWTGSEPTPASGLAVRALAGPPIGDINQLLDAVALGQAVAYVPESVGDRHRNPGVVCVPVEDLSPSQVVAAWPETCRSRAVAGFVRAAVEVASGRAGEATAPA